MRKLFFFSLSLIVMSCSKERINNQLILPKEIVIENLPYLSGGESIEGILIDKKINWQLAPISSFTEIFGGSSMYNQGEPLFILRKDSIMFVIGYKGERLALNSGTNLTISCMDDELKKIIQMKDFLTSGYPNNFMFEIWEKGKDKKSTQRNFHKNSLKLESINLYKFKKEDKEIPIALLKLKIAVVDNNEQNLFDGIINFCYIPRGKTCE